RGRDEASWSIRLRSSSSAPRMFLIMQAEPVHSVVVLWVSHDGVDVIGLLNGEFDDQPRSMNPIVEGAANIVGRTAPRKVQLVEASALNSIKVPLGRVKIRVAHVLLDQREQQFLLWRIEIAGRKSLESAQAVAPPDAGQHVGKKRLGGQDGELGLLRLERADEIEAAQPFVTEHRKTGIWSRQVLQRLGAEEQGRSHDPAAGRGKRRAEMMARKQPSPGLAANRFAEDCNPIVRRPHALDRVASGPWPGRIVLKVFQLLGPQNVVMAHDRCDLVIALAARGRADEIVQSAPAFQAKRADIYSNPRNESDRQIAPRRPLIRLERKGDGLARG